MEDVPCRSLIRFRCVVSVTVAVDAGETLTMMVYAWFSGFDTASSIALLAVTAIAKKGADGSQIHPGDVVILPVRPVLLY